MASAAFRDDDPAETGGAEMVRRLLNHSARARGGSDRAGPNPFAAETSPSARARAGAGAGTARLARPLFERVADPPRRAEEDVARLETELRVLKAALRAEQEEVAALRAELDQVSAFATPVGDIRSDRDRWATLVERLLFTDR